MLGSDRLLSGAAVCTVWFFAESMAHAEARGRWTNTTAILQEAVRYTTPDRFVASYTYEGQRHTLAFHSGLLVTLQAGPGDSIPILVNPDDPTEAAVPGLSQRTLWVGPLALFAAIAALARWRLQRLARAAAERLESPRWERALLSSFKVRQRLVILEIEDRHRVMGGSGLGRRELQRVPAWVTVGSGRESSSVQVALAAGRVVTVYPRRGS
ncbi:MAG: DUF3592 domain-containing protein [Acidimicrobiia bacterium]